MRLVAAMLLVVACSSPKKKDDPEAALLARLTAFKDEMCRCTDAACSEKVQAGLSAWSRELAAKTTPHENVEVAKKMQVVAEEMAACMSRSMAAGSAQTESASGSGGVTSRAIPECEEYRKAVVDYQSCEKISPERRKASFDAYVKSASSTALLDESTRRSVAISCKKAADATRQAASICKE